MSDNEAKPEEEEQPNADAVMYLRHTGEGMSIAVEALAEPTNAAVHFANWLGKNSQGLILLAKEDYNRFLAEHKAAKKVLEVPAPKLVGTDGKRLQ